MTGHRLMKSSMASHVIFLRYGLVFLCCFMCVNYGTSISVSYEFCHMVSMNGYILSVSKLSSLVLYALQEAIGHGVKRQAWNGFDAYFAGYVFSVGDNGVDGDVQCLRDLLVGQSFRHCYQYLFLPEG